jgi:hypothetical protein
MSKSPCSFLLNYESLCSRGYIPKFEDCKLELTPLQNINRDDCLIVYVCHNWLRVDTESPGWDGNSHPDNIAGDVHFICVNGIRELKDSCAPGISECYVWIDFSCMPHIIGAVPEMHKLFILADCIFTPILHDINSAEDCRNANDGIGSRAWCRIEMLYSASVSVINKTSRLDKFCGGLKHFLLNVNARPHVFSDVKGNLKILPPLLPNQFSEFDPRTGAVTEESDMSLIYDLVNFISTQSFHVSTGWAGDHDVNGKFTGVGILRTENGDTYEGPMVDGLKHGKALYKYANGDLYYGDFVKDKRYGEGTLYLSNGEVLQGTFDGNFKKSGSGRLTDANGNVYEGEYSNLKRSGNGTLTTTSRDVYKGNFINNKKNGEGTLKYTSGAIYIGNFINDGINGKGMMHYSNGDVYIGDFSEDKPDGMGVMTYAGGDSYDGDWVGGQRNGRGIMLYANGDRYVGDFESNARHGFGKLSDARGLLFDGNWKDDIMSPENC